MIKLVGKITDLLRDVNPESFYEWNGSEKVKYPYMTFELDGETTGRYSDNYTLEVDIFDNNSS